MTSMREPVSRSLSRCLLLRSLAPNPAGFERLLHEGAENGDWDWILDRATTHKVSALLAGRLDRLGATPRLPQRTQARLRQIRQQAHERVARAQWTLQQVAGALFARGLPFLVVKGSVLAEQVYGDPSLRPFHDVDIVVAPEQVVAAEEAVSSLGYRFISAQVSQLYWQGVPVEGPPDAYVPEDVGREFFQRIHQHFMYAPPDGRLLPIELHWRLTRPWLSRLDPSVLWTHTRSTTVAGTVVSTLTPEAMLLHAATHAMNDGVANFDLLHLVDIAWLLAKYGQGYNADRLFALATEWGVQGDLACALQAIEQAIGTDAVKPFDPRRLQGPIRRSTFRLVGKPRALIDRETATSGLGLAKLGVNIFSEAVWAVATRRMPRVAARMASLAVTETWRRVVGLVKGPSGAPRLKVQQAAAQLGEDLWSLVSAVGVPVEITPITTESSSTRGHDSFVVRLEDGRRLKGRRAASGTDLARIESALKAFEGLPLPRILGRRGHALLFEWIDGTPVTPGHWSPELLRHCGRLQGALHATPPPPGLPSRPDRFASGWQESLERRIHALTEEGVIAKHVGRRTFEIALEHVPDTVERGCTHGAFCSDNLVVTSSGSVYLVDGDGPVLDAIEYDLACTLHLWPMSREQRDAYVEGYSEHRSLKSFWPHLPFWWMLVKVEMAGGQQLAA
jgi:hypothetical protein